MKVSSKGYIKAPPVDRATWYSIIRMGRNRAKKAIGKTR
jgi:hypothetical protein